MKHSRLSLTNFIIKFFQPDQINLSINSPTKIYSDQSDEFQVFLVP